MPPLPGSSPLTRGKLVLVRRGGGRCRLIPAHAGKTLPGEWPHLPRGAHPRSRGENQVGFDTAHTVPGSSPLTRGKPVGQAPAHVAARLIPAHAGKTEGGLSFARGYWAHPRSRGENATRNRETQRVTGSSPLTRGKRSWLRLIRGDRRLIPAHAGKTSCRLARVRRGWAHPRSRGENTLTASALTARTRLIPAHAGKTEPLRRGRVRERAHPRSRGENDVKAEKTTDDRGSSPLTRGKHFLTCAFTAQIDQILETLELAVSSGSYLIWVACATDAPQDPVRSIGLVLPSSRGAS